MEKQSFEPAKKYNLETSIEVAQGGGVSKQFIKNHGGKITLFAFDKGQGLSEHTAPYDAMVRILDGEALITIDGKEFALKDGQSIIMPANVPHALNANVRFKMILTMLRK